MDIFGSHGKDFTDCLPFAFALVSDPCNVKRIHSHETQMLNSETGGNCYFTKGSRHVREKANSYEKLIGI